MNLGDIIKVDEAKLEPFNMICGGSPCQDFSVAGKQKGAIWTCKDCEHKYNPLTVHWSERDKCPNCHSENIEKTRSSLLVEYLRVIRANKPNFGMYENVKNIVGKQFKDTFKMFTDELDEYGYNVYWRVLNAKDYGVPQNRERVYLIFIKKELDNGKFVFPEGFDNGIRLRDVLEDDVDERYYISNDKVEKFLEQLFSNIKKESEKDDNTPIRPGNVYGEQFGTGYAGNVWDTNAISPALMTMQGGGRQPHIMCGIDKSLNGTKFIDNANCLTAKEDRGISNRKSEGAAVIEVLGNVNPSGKGMNGNVFSADGLAPTLTTNKGEGNKIAIHQSSLSEIDPFVVASRGRNPENPSDRTPGAPTVQRLEPKFDGRTNTLTTVQKDNYVVIPQATKAETGICRIESPIRIRKLTPKECFRLMGFSDENYQAAKDAGVSNSQLYKQAGNSIVVDVLYYILVELYKAMPYLFDDLKLSSFFSGIGAFECSLNLLYQRNINFDRSELNIKECEICGSNLRVKHNKITHMFLCEKHCKQIYKYGEITDSSSYNQNDKNEIKLYEDYAMLILKNKRGEIVGESIIDLDDVDLISQYKWTLGNHGYVTSGSGKNQILLHRLLSNAPNNVYVDHINRNKLDNRKLNYRFCTNQENNRNKDLYAHNSSGITGVTWNKERSKWQAQIVVNDKNISLGRFEVFDDAVNARLNAEEKYFKDFMPENRNGLYESINTGNFTNPQAE